MNNISCEYIKYSEGSTIGYCKAVFEFCIRELEKTDENRDCRECEIFKIKKEIDTLSEELEKKKEEFRIIKEKNDSIFQKIRKIANKKKN